MDRVGATVLELGRHRDVGSGHWQARRLSIGAPGVSCSALACRPERTMNVDFQFEARTDRDSHISPRLLVE
jgi:hypothetical protein